MRRTRPALLLAALATLSLAGSALAAGPNTLTIADPAGDNTSPAKASDIVGVTWTTAGSKTGKTYTPKSLVITMALAAPPTSDGTTMYAVAADLTGCGFFSVSYSPGARLIESSGYAGCDGSGPTGDGSIFPAAPSVKGSTVVWTLPLKALPGGVKPGSTFTNVHAYTDLVDPVTGLIGLAGVTEGDAQRGLYDNAATEKPYVVG